MSVAAHPKTNQLGVNVGTPAPRMLELFENQSATAVTQYKAIPIAVPGAAGLGRRIVPAG